MNVSVKIAVASVLDKSGIISLVRSYRSARTGLVLALHRVLPEAEARRSFQPAITITDKIFEELLVLLHQEFHVVSLAQLLAQPEDLEGRQRVALTFDDGWSDTFAYAFPLMLRYRVPATVFLCPGLMRDGATIPEERFARIWQWCEAHHHLELLLQDLRKWGLSGGNSHDRRTWSAPLRRLAIDAKTLMLSHLETAYNVPGCESRRIMTWDEARIMQRSGITFGSHTMHHSTLSAEQPAELEKELLESRWEIESELGASVRWLAYPNGAYNSRVIEIARKAGYSHCFTTEEGGLRRSANPFAIPRINIDDASVVGRIGALHPSRVRFHLQHFYGSAALLAGLTLWHAVSC
jgi:peptidoglycan/xylan/chitin deacetylase (PgdA/CDA1 family)